MSDGKSPSGTSRPGDTLAVDCMRSLMERHGLPRYRQSAWLADALGLSYSQAHRRMNGTSAWSLGELERVATLFGETLSDVFAPGDGSATVRGTVKIGSASLDCQLWLGGRVDRAPPGSMVALQTSTGWSAVIAGPSTEGTVHEIERLQIRPGSAVRKVVAVLDDDEDLTNTICAQLSQSGYDARPFYRTSDLQSSAAVQRYDGYVIDWIVGETSVLKLITALRAQDAACPMVVLTAQVLAGVVDEADIADAVKKFGLVFSEKPVRMSILLATLSRAFSSAP